MPRVPASPRPPAAPRRPLIPYPVRVPRPHRGPDVRSPGTANIQATLDDIFHRQEAAQFGTGRYAL
ncbi:hypothetical protein ABZ726_23605, partial [Streptomyces hundungensis]